MIAIAAAFFVYMTRTPSTFGDASAARRCCRRSPSGVPGVPALELLAKIFMGDSGSLLLGMLLSIATIAGWAAIRSPSGDIAAIAGVLIVPLLVLFIPLLDVVLAIARRTARPGHRARRQGAHPSPADGHRAQPATGGVADVPVERLISGSALAVGLIDGRPRSG